MVQEAFSFLLFESMTIHYKVHPTLPRFSVGMEEWTASYLKLLEDELCSKH